MVVGTGANRDGGFEDWAGTGFADSRYSARAIRSLTVQAGVSKPGTLGCDDASTRRSASSRLEPSSRYPESILRFRRSWLAPIMLRAASIAVSIEWSWLL